MLIVGEKINTSRKRIAEAVEKRDASFIGKVAQSQAQAGAHYIDVNAGTFLEKEADCLCWLVEVVQSAVDLPVCLDSPNPDALIAAIKHHNGEPMINSISLEKDRFSALLPVVAGHPCCVVALCMAETSMPVTVEERVQVGSDIRMGNAILEAIRNLMNDFPGVNTICGLSNVSFGLPSRRLINRNFLALCMSYGLSAAILDPCDMELMSTLLAIELLLGRDEYCENFIDAYQNGRLTMG
jgi:5-methyltetrahydrofolate corrinoid/iron sulfur protein methyltransferase